MLQDAIIAADPYHELGDDSVLTVVDTLFKVLAAACLSVLYSPTKRLRQT